MSQHILVHCVSFVNVWCAPPGPQIGSQRVGLCDRYSQFCRLIINNRIHLSSDMLTALCALPSMHATAPSSDMLMWLVSGMLSGCAAAR